MTSHWRQLTPSPDHLSFADLIGHSPCKVVIEKFTRQDVYDPNSKEKGSMPFVHFRGAHKALGMCKTNLAIVAAIHGEDHTAWPGKEIALRVARLDKDGELCVRVDLPRGKRIPSRYPKFRYEDKATAPEPAAPEPPAQTEPGGDLGEVL